MGTSRWARWPVILVIVIASVAIAGALIGPLSTLTVQISLPRRYGDLQVDGYRRGGPGPRHAEGIDFTLPRDAAWRWYMAWVGHALPPMTARPGSSMWGELHGAALDPPLPMQVVSAPSGTAPRLDLVLSTDRVDAWLRDAALRNHSPWAVQLAAGSRIDDAGMAPEAGFDLALRLSLSGRALRIDGRAGLVEIESLAGRIDIRWAPGASDTRMDARLRLDHLRLRDPHRDDPGGEVPPFLLGLVAEAINRGLADRPPLLPFVVPRDAGLGVKLVGSERR